MDERGPPDAREPNKHPSLYMAEFMAAFSTVMLVIIRVMCPSNHHSPQPQIIPVVKGATYPKLPVGGTEEDNYFNNPQSLEDTDYVHSIPVSYFSKYWVGQKSLFGFFHKLEVKSPNELFDKPNVFSNRA